MRPEFIEYIEVQRLMHAFPLISDKDKERILRSFVV